MLRKLFKLISLGVIMATLMSVILGCEDIDKRTTEAITQQLSEKYGESFTVSSLGNRIGRDTATAYVIADANPTLRFTVRIDKNGNLVFDDYAYRTVCRKTEEMLQCIFTSVGVEVLSYCNYDRMDTTVSLAVTPLEYMEVTASTFLSVTFIIKDTGTVDASTIIEAIQTFYTNLGSPLLRVNIYALSEEDYSCVYDKVLMETQIFNTHRLESYGAANADRKITFQFSSEGPSIPLRKINEMFDKEAN